MKFLKAVLSVKFSSSYGPEDLITLFRQDLDIFSNVPGLLQKYYIAEDLTGDKGGIYIFDSKISRAEFWNSNLAKSIPARYGVIPNSIRVEHFDIPIILNDIVLEQPYR